MTICVILGRLSKLERGTPYVLAGALSARKPSVVSAKAFSEARSYSRMARVLFTSYDYRQAGIQAGTIDRR